MNLKLNNFRLLAVAIAIMTLSGCAAYRTESNIPAEPTSTVNSTAPVLILEGTPDKQYKELGQIEVSVKKLTILNKDPTKEQANEALIEKARALGADAIVKVTYESGIGFTSWGYIDAKGTAIKFEK